MHMSLLRMFRVRVGVVGRGGSCGGSTWSTVSGEQGGRTGRTVSKLTLMEPTLVAPTGTIEKNPCLHLPRRATRSFRTKRFAMRFAIYGETEKSSPTMNQVFRDSNEWRE